MKNIKNIKLPPLGSQDSFGFLKHGTDKQFDDALASIGSTYDEIFKSDTNFNAIFQNLKVDNNPILEPIDLMMNQIFDPNDVKDKHQYEKLSPTEAQIYKEKQNDLALHRDEESESQLLMGEPVYFHNQDQWNYKL